MPVNLSNLHDRIASHNQRLQPDHPAYPWLVLLAVSIGTFMAVLDITIVNIGLAKFQVVFSASTDAVQWVITAYMLVFGVMLAASGWIADRFGYKLTFLLALTLFAGGSFLCSTSWSISTLILFRAIQGIGGGLIQPVGMAIVTREFPPEKRGVALGFWSIAASASISLGPTVGGWIIDNISWQWIFDINVPVGIMGVIVGFIILREYRNETVHSFDLVGFLSLVLFLTPLLLALSEGNAAWNADGWTSPFILTCFAVSFIGFAVFLITELTVQHPLIDLSLFKIYNFSLSAILLFLLGVGMFGSNFLLPLFLQRALGYSPRQAGHVFLPMGVMLAVGAITSGRLTDRIGGKFPAMLGVLLITYCFYRYNSLSLNTKTGFILTNIVILGLGMGLFMAPTQTTAISSMPREKIAQASGLINVIRQIGGSFGVAGLSTLLIHKTTINFAELSQLTNPYSPSFKTILTQLFYYALRATGGTTATAVNKGQYLIVSQIEKQAYVSAIDGVYLFAMIVLALSLVPIILLRHTRRRTDAVKQARTAGVR